jgi:hypothetical protein
MRTPLTLSAVLSTLLLCSACSETSSQAAEVPLAPPASAGALTLPNTREATHAFLKMMDMLDQTNAELKLGTCIPAVQATHPGQVACAVALKIGAGTSETQADFYQRGKEWVAQPSSSQDQLPFPDPKL